MLTFMSPHGITRPRWVNSDGYVTFVAEKFLEAATFRQENISGNIIYKIQVIWIKLWYANKPFLLHVMAINNQKRRHENPIRCMVNSWHFSKQIKRNWKFQSIALIKNRKFHYISDESVLSPDVSRFIRIFIIHSRNKSSTYEITMSKYLWLNGNVPSA